MQNMIKGNILKKNITPIYILALILIAILAILSKIVIGTLVQEQAEYGKIINISGRQRMLSQRITLFAQSLQFQQNNQNTELIKKDLFESIKLMKQANEDLTKGNKIENIALITSIELEYYYFGKVRLYQRVKDFTNSAENALNKNDYIAFLQLYQINALNNLVNDLDRVVNVYTGKSDLEINKLIFISYIILISTIILLLLEALFIFKPMINRIAQQFDQIHKTLMEVKKIKLRLEIEMKTAQRALGNLIPQIEYIDQFMTEKIKLASYYQSASETGGDWWGIYEFDKTKMLVIGDATGHGAGSAIIAAAVSGYFEALSVKKTLNDLNFEEIFKNLNEFVHKIGTDHICMTMAFLIFNEDMSHFKFFNAGHTFPYLINYTDNEEIKITRLKSRGHTLGYKSLDRIPPHDEELEIKATEYEFRPNSIIFLFTDGLTENTNKTEHEFGEKRIKKFLKNKILKI